MPLAAVHCLGAEALHGIISSPGLPAAQAQAQAQRHRQARELKANHLGDGSGHWQLILIQNTTISHSWKAHANHRQHFLHQVGSILFTASVVLLLLPLPPGGYLVVGHVTREAHRWAAPLLFDCASLLGALLAGSATARTAKSCRPRGVGQRGPRWAPAATALCCIVACMASTDEVAVRERLGCCGRAGQSGGQRSQAAQAGYASGLGCTARADETYLCRVYLRVRPGAPPPFLLRGRHVQPEWRWCRCGSAVGGREHRAVCCQS